MQRPDGTFKLFQAHHGHLYYKRDADGAVFLTDDSSNEYHQVAVDKPITLSAGGWFQIPLAGDGEWTPADQHEAALCVRHLGMRVQLGELMLVNAPSPAPLPASGPIAASTQAAVDAHAEAEVDGRIAKDADPDPKTALAHARMLREAGE